MIGKKIKGLDKKKVAKCALIGGGIIALACVSYRIGYEKSGREIVKLVNENVENCGLVVKFRDFWTGEVTPVYMHYEA